MSSSFEKSVKGATKIKNAPPKAKYIEHLLIATHSGEAGVGEVFRAMHYRLRDSTWTVVLKGLLTAHLMIREGAQEVTLAYLSKHRNMLAISSFTDAQTQGRNIRRYANYLTERARAYRETKIDWVRSGEGRLERLSVDKGLLRETEAVLHQLAALLKCDVLDSEGETDITISIFKLLVLDLLALFQCLNQGLINILGRFFEMSRTDAERAMEIYRSFSKYTDYVVQYLSVARQYEYRTGVQVPKLTHAPVNLGRQLEEYLNDSDFEIHRRQYLAEQDFKKGGKSKDAFDLPKPPRSPTGRASSAQNSSNPFPAPPKDAPKPAAKGPDPDLIDFFGSIEQNQTTMQVNTQPTVPGQNMFQPPQQPPQQLHLQPTGFINHTASFPAANNQFQQQQNMFQQPMQQQQPAPLQPNFTGAGFGGFTTQPQNNFQPGSLAPIPQNTATNFQGQNFMQQPQQQQQQVPGQLLPMQTGTTNPFRQSMMMAQPTGMQSFMGQQPLQQQQQPQLQQQQTGFVAPALNRQSTNPFAKSVSPTNNNSPFQSPAPLQAMPTGTNPFARNVPQQQAPPMPAMPGQQQQQQPGALAPQPTGVTNPFRQGDFVNHATGMGWQHNQTPIGGGIDQIQTVPIFPRPAQQAPWQQ
ncbi:ENTH domain containing protein [Cordyceps fumosorosea ARSEF 2679]|uniref:ENTH domain containing protein n=1 Tax=Cordyceps fumosorosea (strain ARSEF 2679) TaxID=1081104 RepID=A0A167WJZ1_CORFA|nr:ENTH domain containing protein [Cordyceps fumosorosea ARSEF 2679]OAA63887.1 ENTH domain containing protein [Cordyceps fumosorosea ARSEF 2679]